MAQDGLDMSEPLQLNKIRQRTSEKKLLDENLFHILLEAVEHMLCPIGIVERCNLAIVHKCKVHPPNRIGHAQAKTIAVI